MSQIPGFSGLPNLPRVRSSLGLKDSKRSSELSSLVVRSKSKLLRIGTKKDGTRVSFTGPSFQHHAHIIGATRTGKSKFVEYLLRQKLSSRKSGFILIDPHGKLYDDLVHYLSHKRPNLAKRVVLFHPAQLNDQIIGFNPIPRDAKKNTEYVVDSLVSSCLKAWKQDTADQTPRIKRWLENIFYLIIKNDLTLVESAALIDPLQSDHRTQLRAFVDPLVRGDWELFEKLGHPLRKHETMEGAANRLRKFLLNPHIRTIIGSQESNLDILKIMNEGKILLVNLHGQGKISDENMRFLGNLFVNEVFRCAMLRDPRDHHLNPCDVIIDEFPDYVNRQVARILDQAGKFQVWLWLIHQHLDQLETAESEDARMIAASIKTNCRTKVCFGGLSRKDAEIMALDLFTGHFGVERKFVKDEIFSTKERHVLDYFEVKTQSLSRTEGTSHTETSGISQTMTSSQSETHSHGSGRSFSWTESQGDSFGESESESTQQSKGYGRSEGIARSRNDFDQATETTGNYSSQSHGTSRGKTQVSQKSFSSTRSLSQSEQQSVAHSKGTAQSEGMSQSESVGESHSQTSGESSTLQPHYRPESYQELTQRAFWSMNELHEIGIGRVKNLPPRWAFIKHGHREPTLVQIDRVEAPFFSRKGSLRRIKKFEDRVRLYHDELHRLHSAIQQEMEARQIRLFRYPLFPNINWQKGGWDSIVVDPELKTEAMPNETVSQERDSQPSINHKHKEEKAKTSRQNPKKQPRSSSKASEQVQQDGVQSPPDSSSYQDSNIPFCR